MFMDTYFASKKLGPSMQGYTWAQLFVTYFGWCKVNPMKLHSVLQLVLKSVFKEDRVVLETTKGLVRSLLEPTLNRRYKTNYRMLRYFRIETDMFMDT